MSDEHTIKQLYQIVAAGNDLDDVLELLTRLSYDAANVLIPLTSSKADSLEIRIAIFGYVKNIIDNLKRIRDNKNKPSEDVSSDE